MQYRIVSRDEVAYFIHLDRREEVHLIYIVKNGQLELIPDYYDIPPWSEDKKQEFVSHIAELLDQGGMVWGAFDDSNLVGMITLGNRFLGSERDLLNLNGMWVSRDYRKKGVASKLIELLESEAKIRGAKGLYVSATPSKNTVEFYQNRGFSLTVTVDEVLFELEPEDIHMIKRF